MAQTGFTPISIYYSSTATNVPTAGNLVAGELAINTADGKLFYKDSSGVVQTIASKAGNVNVSSFSAGTTGLTPNTATTGAVTLGGTLNVANGGTGLTSLTANYIPFGNGTGAFSSSSNLQYGSPTLYLLTPSTGTVNLLNLYMTGARAANNQFGLVWTDSNSETNAAIWARQTGSNNAADIIFGTNNGIGGAGGITSTTERMRIAANGAISISTTSVFGLVTTDIGPNTFTAGTYGASLTHTTSDNGGRPAITVASKGTGQDSAFRTVISPDNGSTFNGWTVGVNIETGSDTMSWCYNSGQSTRVFGSGSVKMRLTTGGGLSTSTGSLGTISDIRMKKDVTDATLKLDELMELRVVNYVLIDDPEERKMLGFVAQEIEQVFPALVEEFDIHDQETKELVMKQKSVKTTVLIPMLVKAIQELNNKVTALEAKLAVK